MSCTELYRFTNKGWPEKIGEVKNAHLGAEAIWYFLEGKYLERFRPMWGEEPDLEYHRITSHDPHDREEIFDLYEEEGVGLNDKIVLLTTCDNAVVYRKDAARLLEAFRNFEGETNLKEQALIIEEAFKKKDTLAIAWNQTSVNDPWVFVNEPWIYNTGKKNYKKYRLIKGKGTHTDIFELL